MKLLRRAGYQLLHFGLPMFLLGLTGISDSSAKVLAMPSATPDEHGPVTAIALDINGNGVFATGREDGYFNSFPLENGRTRYLTYGDPANRYTGVTRIAMTAKGDVKWWIGFQDIDRKPLLWGPTPLKLNPTVELTDVALAADGHDGWLVGRDRKSSASMLWRMRSGKWTAVSPPTGAILWRVAISSDGGHGWGIGISRRNPSAPTVFRLSKGHWSVLPGNPFPKGHVGKLVTVDDAGNGWIIAGPAKERTGPSSLIRLTRAGKLYAVPVNAPTTGINPEPPLVLSALDVDTRGNGWAVGSLHLGITVVDPYITPSDQYKPVPVRLLGDRAVTFPAEAVGLIGYNSKEPNIYPTELVIGPDGVQTILGGIYAGSGHGILYHLHEPWTHPDPPSGPSWPGAGRCFEATPYCLRGEFALAWERGGGLEKLGYPITPELEGKTRLPPSHPQYGEAVTIQYTERARLEYAWYTTPEVTLGQLGRDWEAHLSKGSYPKRQQDMAPFASAIEKRASGWTWFPGTQHNIGPPFLKYWQNSGGLAVYGASISEAFTERAADGKTYLVQYFELSRLEHHPEFAGTDNEVMAGRLGVQVFQSTYGFVP